MGCLECITKKRFPLLQYTTKIEYLNLSGNKFGSGAGLILGPAIAENSSLRHLDLSWNGISHRGAVAIANGIKVKFPSRFYERQNEMFDSFIFHPSGVFDFCLCVSLSVQHH